MRIPENNWRRLIRSKWTSAVVAATAMIFMPLANASMLGDIDARQGSVEPTSQQLGMVSSLGASASWNKLGTPSSLINYGGYLATGLSGSDAATVARNWVDANKALFRLSSVDSLKVISDAAFPWSEAYAVNFRQEVAGLRTAEDGLLTVGIVGNASDGWKIAYVSATTTGDTGLSGEITLTAADAFIKAVQDVDAAVQISDIVTTKIDGEWTTFAVDGIPNVQRVRMRALPTPNSGIRPVYETYYLKNYDGLAQAYMHYVDAENGTVWMRKDIVDQSHPDAEAFSGVMPEGDAVCGAMHGSWQIAAGEQVGTISYAGSATLVTNDATAHLFHSLLPDPLTASEVSSQDTGFSPEANVYSPAGGVPEGYYWVQVCDYGDGAGWTAPRNYEGAIAFNEASAGDVAGVPYPPKWNVFPSSGLISDPEMFDPADDIRKLWCWDSGDPLDPARPLDPACQLELIGTGSPAPWDYNVRLGVTTFTTDGNNARTAEAWASPLTAGGTVHKPVANDRVYDFDWKDEWQDSECFAAFVPGQSHDISAAVTNLFAMHNRVHDWSYNLGFIERRWNAQDSNFGNNFPGTLEGDPVMGNAQAGAATGGASGTYLGRDNANMITLPDGVPPITNMYLWQPIAGAFYAPCKDGDYDMAIIGHEYGHMTENRMIGKGDGRSGHHAGAMGESFGDFSAAEYLNEYGFAPVDGENPFSVGGYATGNGERAIRNFNMSYPRTGAFPEPGSSTTGSGLAGNVKVNPLNFSNMGYDLTGPQVHADGEIWSATNFTVRQYLAEKYDALGIMESDADLQKACADGLYNPANCPGNRRWMQIVFDAMLLMPPATSMLEARDAYLAADMMRFGGANQDVIWRAFAHRGMGNLAESDNSVADPVPDFSTHPDFAAENATVTFEVVDPVTNASIPAEIYVGHYEAHVSRIADTNDLTTEVDNGINFDDVAQFAAGPYEFVARADGYGHFRFAQEFAAGETKTIRISMPKNYASGSFGATVTDQAVGGAQEGNLINETELDNWDWEGAGVSVKIAKPHATVDLVGSQAVTINRVQVSAMLRGENRFTALRQFRIETKNAHAPTVPEWTEWMTSAPDAFPGHTPRPVSPELILRSFDGAPVDATHVRIVALNNQCTGNLLFQGEQDLDPTNPTDCTDPTILPVTIPIFGEPTVLAPRHDEVHIAALQVFGAEGDVECISGCEVNQAPVANDDGYTVDADGSDEFDVRLNDTDDTTANTALTVTINSGPMCGTVDVDAMTQLVTYTHNETMCMGDEPTDSFTYNVTDENGATSAQPATVTITINRDGGTGNVAPVANDDPGMGPAIQVNAGAGNSVNYDVRLNDTDDSDVSSDLNVTIVSNGMSGNAVVQMDGTVTYTHGGGMATSDTFTYYVTDSEGATSNTATVTITINQDGGTGGNECADDTDSDYKDCRVKGSGDLNDGADMNDDSDSDKFTIETKQKGSNPDGSPHVDGKLYFDTDGPMRKVRGTPNAQSINGSSATVWGTCEYESDTVAKQNCTFEVNVTETDQFGIKIYDMGGGLLYEYNKQTIIYGGIDVRSDEEYE